MSKERVVISGAVMRVSVVGADASVAQFGNLIFDGNQPPLRLWSTGWMAISVLGFSDHAAAVFGTGPTVPTTPPGTTPIFFCSVRQPNMGAGNPGGVGNFNTPAIRTYNYYGAGGAIAGGVFLGFNCNRENLAGGLFGANQGVVNYAIMKNYQ